MPASEALLDEETIKRFRARYREQFGANATGDPLYQAISDGRRLAGMEHWLPLFEDKLATLFDHLGENDVIVRDAQHGRRAGSAARGDRGLFRQSRDRRWSPSPAAIARWRRRRSTCRSKEWRRRGRGAADPPAPRPSHEPESDKVIDFGVDGPRDFAPERAQSANVYEAVTKHVAKLRKDKKKIVLASYTAGARERLAGLLEDHGLKSLKLAAQLAGGAGRADRRGADRPAARPWLHRRRRSRS